MTFDVAQQKLREPTQPGLHVQRFQDGLPVFPAGQHGTRNQIRRLFRIGDGIQITNDFLRGKRRRRLAGLARLLMRHERKRKRHSELNAFLQEFPHGNQQRVGGGVVAREGRQRGDTMNAIGSEAHGLLQLHASQALQDQMRRAVLVGDRHPDQAKAGDFRWRLALAAGPAHGNGKEAIGVQGIGEHLPIARLENVERQQRLGEQRGVGEGHHRHFTRQIHGSNIGNEREGASLQHRLIRVGSVLAKLTASRADHRSNDILILHHHAGLARDQRHGGMRDAALGGNGVELHAAFLGLADGLEAIMPRRVIHGHARQGIDQLKGLLWYFFVRELYQ